jgi:hypothetical protein
MNTHTLIFMKFLFLSTGIYSEQYVCKNDKYKKKTEMNISIFRNGRIQSGVMMILDGTKPVEPSSFFIRVHPSP